MARVRAARRVPLVGAAVLAALAAVVALLPAGCDKRNDDDGRPLSQRADFAQFSADGLRVLAGPIRLPVQGGRPLAAFYLRADNAGPADWQVDAARATLILPEGLALTPLDADLVAANLSAWATPGADAEGEGARHAEARRDATLDGDLRGAPAAHAATSDGDAMVAAEVTGAVLCQMPMGSGAAGAGSRAGGPAGSLGASGSRGANAPVPAPSISNNPAWTTGPRSAYRPYGGYGPARGYGPGCVGPGWVGPAYGYGYGLGAGGAYVGPGGTIGGSLNALDYSYTSSVSQSVYVGPPLLLGTADGPDNGGLAPADAPPPAPVMWRGSGLVPAGLTRRGVIAYAYDLDRAAGQTLRLRVPVRPLPPAGGPPGAAPAALPPEGGWRIAEFVFQVR